MNNFATDTVIHELTQTYEGDRLSRLMVFIADDVQRMMGLRNAFLCAWEVNHEPFRPGIDLDLMEVDWQSVEAGVLHHLEHSV